MRLINCVFSFKCKTNNLKRLALIIFGISILFLVSGCSNKDINISEEIKNTKYNGCNNEVCYNYIYYDDGTGQQEVKSNYITYYSFTYEINEDEIVMYSNEWFNSPVRYRYDKDTKCLNRLDGTRTICKVLNMNVNKYDNNSNKSQTSVSLPIREKVDITNFTTSSFQEMLDEEKIEKDFSNYVETDDQIIIYLFRGTGCNYCKEFLKFLNSIAKDYGTYFRVVGFEVWYNTENSKLLSKVADLTGVAASGVPYIIIGDKVFNGYASKYNDEIKEKIIDEYYSNFRYDVIKALNETDG